MANAVQGRFWVLDERATGGKGYTVRDQRAAVVYYVKRKSEAVEACNRLNVADGAAP